VPIWVERFALAVLATVFVGAVILNVLKMDWIQRTGLGIGILGISVYLAQSLYLFNKAKADTNTSQQEEPKKPIIQQSSQGNNSPNTTIIGDNATIINGDPKSAAKLDEILKLLRSEKGEHAKPENFLKKYPLGYIIFDIDQKSSVFPYATESLLRNWEFDWSNVKLTEDHERNILWLTLPDMTGKTNHNTIFRNNRIGGQKKIGQFDGIFLTDGTMAMKGEILSIRPSGIVFLIGFDHAPKADSSN